MMNASSMSTLLNLESVSGKSLLAFAYVFALVFQSVILCCEFWAWSRFS